MSNYIEKNLSKSVEQTLRNWKNFTQRAIDSIKISTSAVPQTPQCLDEEYETSWGESKKAKNLFDQFRNNPNQSSLKENLMTKY
jgi:hypothetical protein